MARRKRRFTFFHFISLFPLWTALFGLIVTGYGWITHNPERIHQGLAFMTTFLLCVGFMGALVALSFILWFVGWCYQKLWS